MNWWWKRRPRVKPDDLRRAVESYIKPLVERGLIGPDDIEVVCDRTNNSERAIEEGRLKVDFVAKTPAGEAFLREMNAREDTRD